jgi:hypothetical protein
LLAFDVRLPRYEDELSIPEIGPVLDDAASIHAPDTPGLQACMLALEELLRAELQAHGSIRIEKESGVSVGRGG